MKIFKVMNYLIKKQAGFVLLSLALGVLTVLSNMGLLGTSAVLISRAALHPDVLDLMVLIVAVRFFGISRGAFRYLERLFSHDTTFRILSSVRKWFYKGFNDNYSENSSFKTGDVYTKIVNNVDDLKEYYLRGIHPLIIAALTGIITSLYICYFNHYLALIYSLIYAACGFLLPVILFGFNRKFVESELELKEKMNKLLIDMLNGILEVKTYKMENYFKDEFSNIAEKRSSIQKKKTLINAIGENMHGFLAALIMALALITTEPVVSGGKLSGIYYAMLPLVIMSSFEALIPMSNILYKFDEAYNSGKGIFSIIDNKSSQQKESADEIHDFCLEVENLSIYKPQNKESIIRDLSFRLPYGKKLAIVGASGSGKSTILRALLGFITFQDGDIKIGDKSYKQLEKEKVRILFSYIDQTPYVFNASIKENLLIANPEATDKEINSAMDASYIKSFIESLPQGIDTALGQYGYNISGGEKQRLVISRALLKNAPIMLLDEPTASLDIKLEKKVIEELHKTLEGKSCIWVTHRLVSMEKMDEIIVMHKGKVVERGTHKELLELKGHYYKLWNIQVNI